jgi:hypothetical protein
MNIKNLLKNIKNSPYNKSLKSITLDEKYVSFCEIEKGRYYTTLELTALKRTRTDLKIIESNEKNEYELFLINLISNDKYDYYKSKIINFFKNENIDDRYKHIIKILCMTYNIFNNDDLLCDKELQDLHNIKLNKRSFKKEFLLYYNMDRRYEFAKYKEQALIELKNELDRE